MTNQKTRLNRLTNQETRLNRLRALSKLLDNAIAIPGTPYRVGLDPLLGLIPAAGDYLSAAFSAYIVVEAARFGLPNATISRMVFNIVLDALVGIVPMVGDLFDFAWKANTANLALLEEHLDSSPTETKANWLVLIILLAVLLLIIIGITTVTWLVLSSVFSLLGTIIK